MELTDEQKRIKEDFMNKWLEELPRYKMIEKFNHTYPTKYAYAGERVLEIGAGTGEHINYEHSCEKYYALEILPAMANKIRAKFPNVEVITGDCQEPFPLEDNSIDRVNAIHVLEHLTNLPATLKEIKRVLKPFGTLVAMIPCEGMAYKIARKISAERLFKKTYKMDYDWLVKSEHVNSPKEIITELNKEFSLTEKRYFPFALPLININLVIGLIYERN